MFDPQAVDAQLRRLDALTPDTKPVWGRMNAAEMLAHLNVSYEMVYETKHAGPNAFMRLILRAFVKQAAVGPAPYKKNAPTAPAFRIQGPRDVVAEKARLIADMRRVQTEGRGTFDGRQSLSFGPLTADERQVLFGKHLDHLLPQFGV